MDGSFSLSGSIEVHDRLFEVSNLVSKSVVLPRLELKLLFDILHPLIHLTEPQLIHFNIISLLFILLPELLYLSFSHVDFVLIGLHLSFALLEHLSLVVGNIIELFAHLGDLFGLGMVDVRLSGYLLLAGLDVRLCILILGGEHLVVLAGLGQLDLHVPERVLELLVLVLC